LQTTFDDGIYDVFCDLFKEGIYPIVYSYIDGIEKFSYILKMHRRNEGLP